METKKVFISYSWAVQSKVLELANRLISNGVEVIIDVYDLKDGQDKYAFMEQSVTNKSIDRVLLICDKTYCEKANKRSGGVGDEIVIISPEVYEQVDQLKFIPILFERDENGQDCLPQFLKSRIYINLIETNPHYEEEYEKLLRNIFEKPLLRKPALGNPPDWLNEETTDFSSIRDVIKQIKGYTGTNQTKLDSLYKRAKIEFVTAIISFKYFQKQKEENKLFLSALENEIVLRNLYIELISTIIANNIEVSDFISSFFEYLYNSINRNIVIKDAEYFYFAFVIQELFIQTTALLLFYEQYKELNNIITHTYFFKSSTNTDEVYASNYFRFSEYNHYIERDCKPYCHEPKLYTLTGYLFVNRVKEPILTSEAISNADLVLYQLGELLITSDRSPYKWFPDTYIYHSEKQAMWQKLKSKEYCEKIKELFGVKDVEELKALISKSNKHNNDGFHSSSIHTILRSINIDEIAVMK